MLRRPFFWIAFALVSIGMAGFAYWFFPRAFPIVSLDITMNRAAALAAARDVAAKEHVGPEGFREAASFTLDEETQTFVELEGGGKAAFARLMTSGLYSPYTWEVRHFKEGEKHESTIRFTPDGRPYGFVERLRQDAPGAALASDAAQTIGEAAARADWGVPLDAFTLVERSDEKQPGGRVDHTFVYERPGQRLGEGRYRLRLVVSGDRLTEVTWFIQIPEAFTRRYEHMRSANNAIGVGSTIGMLVLYVLGGIGVGLFFLLRQRWVIWRQPVLWGVFIALLQLAASLNEWPLAWMGYDTALSVQTYALQTIGAMVAGALGLGVLLALSFMAAESLGRRAFPSHPQLWKMWSREADGAPEILGRTAAGYLLVATFFAYEVALYFMTTRVLGWWTPSEALVHPDVLATYQPWVAAIAPSAQAGFWEESLFRAVPLAGAALIGDRLGGRRWWIVGAMIVQAAVFGAGHAPYPTEPAYARAAELVLPAIGFGLLYLRFGLLPSVVLHYTFDVTWFALPVFVSSGATARVSQALIVLFTLVPLWMVLRGRVRAGRWRPLDAALRNGAWTPPAPADNPAPAPAPPASGPAMSPGLIRGLAIAGLAALVVWAFARPFRAELPPLTVGRAVAEQAARDTLAARGVTLDAGWRVLPTVEAGGDAGQFVWRTAGRDRYFSLLGTYLPLPHWRVRVARFEGDLEARAEEWHVEVGADGGVERVSHTLPEARPGASLSEQEARRVARDAVRERFGLVGASLEDVSTDASKRPKRMDWDITFKDTSVAALPQGEPRITVTLVGDEVADVRRYVFVPEEWQRRQRSDDTRAMIVQSLGAVLVAGLVFAGAIGGVVAEPPALRAPVLPAHARRVPRRVGRHADQRVAARPLEPVHGAAVAAAAADVRRPGARGGVALVGHLRARRGRRAALAVPPAGALARPGPRGRRGLRGHRRGRARGGRGAAPGRRADCRQLRRGRGPRAGARPDPVVGRRGGLPHRGLPARRGRRGPAHARLDPPARARRDGTGRAGPAARRRIGARAVGVRRHGSRGRRAARGDLRDRAPRGPVDRAARRRDDARAVAGPRGALWRVPRRAPGVRARRAARPADGVVVVAGGPPRGRRHTVGSQGTAVSGQGQRRVAQVFDLGRRDRVTEKRHCLRDPSFVPSVVRPPALWCEFSRASCRIGRGAENRDRRTRV